MPHQQKQPKPKPRSVGRPKLHELAKSSIVPVRFSAEDRRKVEAAARASKQSVSEWIRSTLTAALEA
jgi:predicted HicB family RNase H-like nuclease